MHHLVPALAAALVIATAVTGGAVDGRVGAGRQAAYPQVLTSVVNKSIVNGYWTNMGQVIGSCKVGTSGSKCTISSGKSATRTVDLAFGISRGAVTGSLGIKNGSTVSVSTSCSSPPLAAGRVYRAYPIGQKWQYKVKKITHLGVGLTQTQTSGLLTAFNPSSTHIYCV